MKNSCKWTPTVSVKKGKKTVEVDSKLFGEIKKVVKDNETSWKMWAYSKTPYFKEKYPNVEYDELGEATFPSLIKALGLKEEYDLVKEIQQVIKDYELNNAVFTNPEEAVQRINDFNSKEQKFVAYTEKVNGKDELAIRVVPKDSSSIQIARQQAYNNALTKEIISLMNSLGFDVNFVNSPEYKGIFDPTNATMHDGLITVINISKGIEGEEALPEEFSHFIIEGLINHPLVQRLLSSLDDAQLQSIFGDSYDQYFDKYGGDMMRMKKEAAGKLLAQYITKKGTIQPKVVSEKKGLLSRIWNWAKGLFSKVTDKHLASARERAFNSVAGIYNLMSSEEGIALFDKHAVLSGEQMYLLKEELNTPEKLANKALELSGRLIHSKRRKTMSGKVSKEMADSFKEVKGKVENYAYVEGIESFLLDVQKNLLKVAEEKNEWASVVKDAYVPKEQDIRDLRAIAGYVNSVQMLDDGYRDLLTTITTLDEEENYKMFMDESSPMSKEHAEVVGNSLAKTALNCLNVLNSLVKDKQETERRVLYMYARTIYKNDITQDSGKDKGKILSLKMIIEHADKDISFIERWISALSDASDSLLPMIDSLVKSQQYDRDMEMIEWKKQIFLADQKLRKAGFSSDIMYQINKYGIPTGRIRSQYDFDGYNEALKKKKEELAARFPNDEESYKKELRLWKRGSDKNFENRLIKIYIDPKYQKLYDEGKTKEIPEDAIFDEVPNPKVFTGERDAFERDFPVGSPQREYYDTMISIKHKMMMKIPHRGQGTYKATYISKDLAEGILDNSTGNPMRATYDYFAKHFTRRPDDIGFGTTEDFKDDIIKILKEDDNPETAADRILLHLADSIDQDIYTNIRPKSIEKIIKDKSLSESEKAKKIIGTIASGTFYEVDTDFANHRIQRLPIYYTRPLRRDKERGGGMPLLSTDFTGTMVAYSAMAVNYEKMNEIVDIIEVARDYTAHERELRDTSGKSPYSMFQAFGTVFQGFVVKAGNGSNSAGRLEDYINSVVYEQHKDKGSVKEIFGVNLDTAKTLDAIKDYTGLLMLGLNAFSTISNITVGKIQQWIEAFGGEDFNVKDYALAIQQYTSNIWECMAEMASPIKHNKLSLLIEMFDPMKDYYESLRETNGGNIMSRIFGQGALGYIGMNAGEHILRVQTMLACLNHIKLVDMSNPDGDKISLYDALEVVTDKDGISRLELKPNLAYERDLIDNTGTVVEGKSGKVIASNKNYGKPVRDENGKIKTELVQISTAKNEKDKNLKAIVKKNHREFIYKKRKRIGKVNDSLNGAFNVVDKGAAHRMALLRLALQFRQWMPAHYSRRFAPAHYDGDLEQWREGYYITVGRLMNSIYKDIRKGQFEYVKLKDSMSEHEKANFRRAEAEIGLFAMLFTLVRVGGRVKDRDRSWADKMALYQIHRMYLEVGASVPSFGFLANVIQLLNSPAAAISTLDKVKKVFNIMNAFDEIQTGRYQGWSEWERDVFQMIPYLPQIWKAIDFDDSMFSMFERDD